MQNVNLFRFRRLARTVDKPLLWPSLFEIGGIMSRQLSTCKFKVSSLSGFIFILTFLTSLQAQVWGPEMRLTYDGATSNTSNNNAWCVAASGDTIHVLWFDERDGNAEIYYKCSSDNGSTWADDSRLTDDPASSQYPSIAVQGSNIHVVWADRRDGPNQPYYKHSADNGQTWSEDTGLSDTLQPCFYPSVAARDDNVHVVWEDGRHGWNGEIYYTRSPDNGDQWIGPSRLTVDAAQSGSPSVAVREDNVHVVWQDKRDGEFEIYYKRWIDIGSPWEPDRPLTSTGQSSWYPCLAVQEDNVHVVWQDNRDGNFEIYYIRSTDNGATWGVQTRLTTDTADSYFPSIAVADDGIYVVWQDSRDGNAEIYYKASADNGETWGADTRLTEYRGDSKSPSIAVSGDDLHVVWWDERSENGEIFYRHGTLGASVEEHFEYPPYFLEVALTAPTIRYSLPSILKTDLAVVDVTGRRVKTVVSSREPAGYHEVSWNGCDDCGNPLPAGVYFCRLRTNQGSRTAKMLLIR